MNAKLKQLPLNEEAAARWPAAIAKLPDCADLGEIAEEYERSAAL